MTRWILAILLSAAVAAAAGIDGRWKSEVSAAKPDKAGKKGKQQSGEIIFDLKSSGNQLNGTVTAGGGKRGRAMQIQDGKIDGDSFSFTTVQKSRKGEAKWTWRGAVKGDELTGTRTREGGRRGQPFTAKRSN